MEQNSFNAVFVLLKLTKMLIITVLVALSVAQPVRPVKGGIGGLSSPKPTMEQLQFIQNLFLPDKKKTKLLLREGLWNSISRH